jgi:hypothetical protein
MLQEIDNTIADQTGGRVVTGDDQLEQSRKQLLLGQAVVVVAGGHQHAYEIVLVMLPMGRDEMLQ